MRTLELNDVEAVAGGQPTLSGVVTAVGLGVLVATAPAWGAVAALIGLAAIGVAALEP
jgi:hypothetical protein